ncbi:MAG: hypothetical protein ACREXY_11815 [Gammaproteobacteria bacterium]
MILQIDPMHADAVAIQNAKELSGNQRKMSLRNMFEDGIRKAEIH